MSMDAINAAIEAARSGAAAAVPAAGSPGSVPAVGVAPGGGYPAPAPVTPGKAVSLGELLNQGGMRVDAYLKVDKSGFYIGTDTTTLVDEINVEFRLSDVVPFFGLRFGNPAKYLRSHDRMTEARSKKPWAQCVAEAQAADSRCRGDYPSADIPFVALDSVEQKKGEKKTLLSPGQTLGLTLSVTNFKDFAAFIKPMNDLVELGRLPHDLMLRGKLVHAQRKDASNTWGAATFVDFVAVEQSALDAAAEAEAA